MKATFFARVRSFVRSTLALHIILPTKQSPESATGRLFAKLVVKTRKNIVMVVPPLQPIPYAARFVC